MSARKTWSDNTIDERSIAFSSSRPNESTHAHARREFSLRPVCPVTRDLSFPPPFLPVLFLSFVYHGLLSPSYPYVTLTYRVVGLRVRASCCIRSLNWVSIFIGWPTGARRERFNAREISTGRTNRPSPLRLILVLSRSIELSRDRVNIFFNYSDILSTRWIDHRIIAQSQQFVRIR